MMIAVPAWCHPDPAVYGSSRWHPSDVPSIVIHDNAAAAKTAATKRNALKWPDSEPMWRYENQVHGCRYLVAETLSLCRLDEAALSSFDG